MDKLNIMNEINEILDSYCEGCFVKMQLSKEIGKTGSHKFCIQQCTVGEQLKFLGSEMNKLLK